IDIAEDRQRCQQLIEKEGLLQPRNEIAKTLADLQKKSNLLGFPLILRPSYVIGGKFMEVVYQQKELHESRLLAQFDEFKPLLIEEFLNDAQEVEVDAISDEKDTYIAGITEHFEKAGIHSGDSTSILP